MEKRSKRGSRPIPDALSSKAILFKLEDVLDNEDPLICNYSDRKPWEVTMSSRDAKVRSMKYLKVWFDLPPTVFFTAVSYLDSFLARMKLAKLFSYTWGMGLFVCKAVHYFQNVSAICSVMTLTTISIERYYAIVHPIKAKYICTLNQAKWIIFFIWIMSLVLAVPTLIAMVHLQVLDNENPTEYFLCVKDWDSVEIWQFHELYMLVLIFIVPCTIMTYSYTTICWEIKKIIKGRSEITSKHVLVRNRTTTDDSSFQENFTLAEHKRFQKQPFQDDTKMVKQIIYMLVAIVVLFGLCWGPILIDNVLVAYSILPILRCGYQKQLLTAFHLISYFNSCLNPIVYGFMSKSFRKSFMLVLCCPSNIKKKQTINYSLKYVSRTGSHTRATSFR